MWIVLILHLMHCETFCTICDAQVCEHQVKGNLMADRWSVSHHNNPEALPSATVTPRYLRAHFHSSHHTYTHCAVTFYWRIHSITSPISPQLNWLRTLLKSSIWNFTSTLSAWSITKSTKNKIKYTMHDNHLCMNDMIILIKLNNGKKKKKIWTWHIGHIW